MPRLCVLQIVEMESNHSGALKALQEKNERLLDENRLLKQKLEGMHTLTNSIHEEWLVIYCFRSVFTYFSQLLFFGFTYL